MLVLLLSRILGFLLLLLILRSVLRLLSGVLEGLRGGGAPSARQTRGADGRPVPLVRDPVCGTFVVPERALSSVAGGKAQYFCSEECRRKFERGATSRSA